MLARLQALISLSLLCAVAGWILLSLNAGQVGWALTGVFALAAGFALFMASEFVMMRAVQRREGGPVPSLGQLLRAWRSEVLTAPRVFLWRQPFRSRAVPDFLPRESTGRVGVVLVHGFFCNRGLWNPWLEALRERGTPFVAVNLEPVFRECSLSVRRTTVLGWQDSRQQRMPVNCAPTALGCAISRRASQARPTTSSPVTSAIATTSSSRRARRC